MRKSRAYWALRMDFFPWLAVLSKLLITGDLLGFVKVLAADGIVAETDGIALLEPVGDVVFGARVVFRGDVQRFAKKFLANVALFHQNAAGFDDITRKREHCLFVLVGSVNRDVSVGAGAQVALVLEAEDAGWAGAGNDGDVV